MSALVSSSLHNRVGQRYLESLNNPPIYDGGALSRMLHDVKVIYDSPTNTTQLIIGSSFDFGAYFYQLFFNKSRPLASQRMFNRSILALPSSTEYSEGYAVNSVFCILYILLVFLLGIVFICCWIVINKSKYHYIHQFIKYKYLAWRYDNYYNNEIPVKIFTQDQIQLKQLHKSRKRLCIIAVTSIILTVIFTIVFVFHFVSVIDIDRILISSTDYSSSSSSSSTTTSNPIISLPNYTEPKVALTNNLKSFYGSWKLAADKINQFFIKALTDSELIFINSMETMITSLKNILLINVRRLTDLFLEIFGVKNLFAVSNQLMTNLNVTVTSMDYVNSNSRKLIQELNIFKGKISGFTDGLSDEVKSYCVLALTGNNNLQQCLQISNEISEVRSDINTSRIQTESSVNMQFILTQFNLNISHLNENLKKLETDFKTNINKMTTLKVNDLKLDEATKFVASAWSFINSTIFPWKESFSVVDLIVSSSLTQMGIILILFTTVFILIPTILLMCCYYWLFKKYVNKFYLEYIIHKSNLAIQREKSFISIIDNYKSKQKLKKITINSHITQRQFYIYFSTFSITIFIISIVSIIFCFAAILINNEVCVQYNSNVGINVVDNILNEFMNNYWKIFIQNITIGTNNDFNLNVKVPNNILRNLRDKCVKSRGVFFALDYTNAFNISGLLWTETNMNYLRTGMNDTYKALTQLNMNQFIPSDLKSLFNIAKNITEYFDKINYMSSIEELSKPLIVLPNYMNWMNESISFFSKLPQSTNQDYIIKRFSKLRQLLVDNSNLKSDKEQFRFYFQRIQDHRENNILINQMLNQIDLLQKVLSPSSPDLYDTVKTNYNKVMFNEFIGQAQTNLTAIVNNLILRIFPCEDIIDAVIIVLTSCCDGNSISAIFATYGVNGIVLGVVMMILMHLGLVIVRYTLNETYEVNCCTC